MILVNQHPIKVFRKPKNDNLYIYNYSKPFKDNTTKIIIKKNKLLKRQDEDEDYWEFIVSKVVKLSQDWRKLVVYLKNEKFEYCKKVKIFAKFNKAELKVQLFKKNECFLFSTPNYIRIDLNTLRDNPKLYKKFENRYCYYKNYFHPDCNKFADTFNANLWFQWFAKNYPKYQLPFHQHSKNNLTLGFYNSTIIDSEEPKMDYDYIDLYW